MSGPIEHQQQVPAQAVDAAGNPVVPHPVRANPTRGRGRGGRGGFPFRPSRGGRGGGSPHGLFRGYDHYDASTVPEFTVQKEKKPKAKKVSKAHSPKSEAVLKICAGELATLSVSERGAVLSKLNGTFGTSPKVKEDKKGAVIPRSKDKSEKSDKAPKNPVNLAFMSTAAGQFLAESGRLLNQATRSSTKKPSVGLSLLNRSLLKKKAAFKQGNWATSADADERIRLFGEPVTLPELSSAFQQILDVADVLVKELKESPTEYPELQPAVLADDMVDLCLGIFRGIGSDILPEGLRAKIVTNKVEKVSPFVERSDQEKEDRKSILLSKRKEQKKRKANKPSAAEGVAEDPQGDDEAMLDADAGDEKVQGHGGTKRAKIIEQATNPALEIEELTMGTEDSAAGLD